MSNPNIPNVKKFTGKVKRLRTGFIVAFTIESIKNATIEATKLLILIPGTTYATTHSKNAFIKPLLLVSLRLF